MNKDIFKAVCDRLVAEVEELAWVDWDDGQLDMQAGRAPVALPSCLVDVSYPRAEDIDNEQGQVVAVQVSLRFAFAPTGSSAAVSPVRDDALAAFGVMDKAHVALQSWTNDWTFSHMSRQSGTREKRRDGLKVYRVLYNTGFQE